VTALYLVLGLLALAGVLYLVGKGRGRSDATRDAAEEGVADATKANEARAGVDRLPDGGAADKLRNEWSR
jgi:hypothetical protein